MANMAEDMEVDTGPGNAAGNQAGFFVCRTCLRGKALSGLHPLAHCTCLVCKDCLSQHAERELCIRSQLLTQAQQAHVSSSACPAATPPSTRFVKGDRVIYHRGDGSTCFASVVGVDRGVAPPAYSVQLDGASATRETEQHRLRRLVSITGSEIATPSSSGTSVPAAAPVRCPVLACGAPLSDADLSAAAPAAWDAWCEAATEATMRASGYIRCPNAACGIWVERLPPGELPPGLQPPPIPELARPAATAPAGTDAQGRPLSREAARHHALHRYRCCGCQSDFCGQCLAVPYHDGLTCAQAAAPRCLYCDDPLLHLVVGLPPPLARQARPTGCQCGRCGAGGGAGGPGCWRQGCCQQPPLTALSGRRAGYSALTVRDLHAALAAAGGDGRWCMEKTELVELVLRLEQVCARQECRARLRAACTRRLPCGHWCGGVRGEDVCLPCLQGCGREAGPALKRRRSAQQDACQMCWEPLAAAPALALRCGHVCHLHCAREQLQQGYPGPAISFGFLACPMCRGADARAAGVQAASAPVELSHPALAALLDKPLALQADVVRLAKRQLKLEGLATSAQLAPGGAYEGRPADYALSLFQFFQCSRCARPYCGGRRACDVAAGDQAYDPQHLVCGGCTAAAAGAAGRCAAHGTDALEWKCRNCCAVAAWFCFGTTHLCNACHTAWNQGRTGPVGPPCTPATCALRAPHPPHGAEHCLGCALCRHAQAV